MKNQKLRNLNNVAEAIIQTTKENTMPKKTKVTSTRTIDEALHKTAHAAPAMKTTQQLWDEAVARQKMDRAARGPAIPERKPNEVESARLLKYKDSVLMRTLAYALSKKRPHEGVGERSLLGYLLLNRPDNARWTFDRDGNLHIDMRKNDSNRTLFVAHVDTVHRDDGPNKIRMTESVWYACGSQLGADDGSGVALLMHLMHAGVGGYYLFTVGEECGGVGSSQLVERRPGLFKHFDRAIAFDRKGTTSVISHQGTGRCCSDAFAEALSTALSQDDLLYMPDDGGVYTDTAEFIDIIPECTNVSVGYVREHSDEEAQDILHLQAMADTLVKIDWDALPTERDPSVRDYGYSRGYSYGYDDRHSITDADYDFRLFLDEEELASYEEIKAAALGLSTRGLAVCMAAVVEKEYLGDTEHALRQAQRACECIDDEGYRIARNEIEGGADVERTLLELYEAYLPS